MDRYFYIEPDHGKFFIFISDLDDNLLKLIDAITEDDDNINDNINGEIDNHKFKYSGEVSSKYIDKIFDILLLHGYTALRW